MRKHIVTLEGMVVLWEEGLMGELRYCY